MARSDSEAGGFVLKDAEGPAERGRTLRPAGCGRESGLKFLLLENGRLFRIVHRGARQGRFELLGWETPGAYLVASPEPDGWSLVPMVAAGGLEDLEPIVVLLAAEVLDAEQPLTAEEP